MISDQDRKLAEETFGLIERSNPEPAPMTTPDTTGHDIKRRDIISGLRAMADALESRPGLPTPYDVDVNIFWQVDDDGGISEHITQEHARAAMAALPGGWVKDINGNYVSYDLAFGDDVTYSINVQRSEVCRKVQVGTKSVPAHDEPVYEWRCEPDETDVSMALAEHTAAAHDAILPTGMHIAGTQPAADDGDGGRSYESAARRLAEHTQPALDVIEQASWTDPGPFGAHSIERD